MGNAVDYEAVIADLEEKRVAFNTAVDGAIQGIRQVLAAINGLPSGVQQTPPGTTVHLDMAGGASITPATFFGLGLAEAAIRYLQVVKKQQTTREIADALESAHYHHTSQNFVNTVNTALYRRERDEADVVRIGRNWALAEWYPGRRRGRAPAANEPDAMPPEEQ
jgi:hypothetical protein